MKPVKVDEAFRNQKYPVSEESSVGYFWLFIIGIGILLFAGMMVQVVGTELFLLAIAILAFIALRKGVRKASPMIRHFRAKRK